MDEKSRKKELINRRALKPLYKVFCFEENYYFESWLNGNKNHVISHLALCLGDRRTPANANCYNHIINQFSHDATLLEHILNRAEEMYSSQSIDVSYL